MPDPHSPNGLPNGLPGRLPIGFPIEAADRCVMCGLCQPHCPTYRLSRDEGESPRGRIALMIALARGQLEATPTLQGHLDRCLGCGACERACPSRVPYGELIDSAQALLQPGRSRSRRLLQRVALDRVLARPARVRGVATLLRLAQRSGLDRLGALLGLGRARALLPPLSAARRWQPHYPADAGNGDENAADKDAGGEPVALFTGCTGAVLDAAAIDAAIALLTRFGHDVHIPPSQTCCGALHQHNGDPQGAGKLRAANRQVFGAASPTGTVLGIASACTLELRQALHPGDDHARMPAVTDVAAFLATRPWPTALVPAALNATVALHLPCSQVHGLRTGAATRELLAHIPGLRLVELDTRGQCCGAAGSYMFRQPAMADRLGRETLTRVAATGATRLLSSNIGCRLQLAALARRDGIAIEILHPLTLLQGQIDEAQSAKDQALLQTS